MVARASSRAAKDTFRWRFFVSAVQDLPLEEMASQARRFTVRLWSNSGGWVILTVGTVSMLYWNGRLVIATGIGVAVMLMVYLMHDWKPERSLSELRRFLQGWNQPFALSVGIGSVATLSTYLATSIWADSESPWIASGSILQGMGTLAILVLLGWQWLNRSSDRQSFPYHRWLSDLTHEDPLKRLVAVRQLTDMVSVLEDNGDLAARGIRHPSSRAISDCFRLMLTREPDPIVRDAVYDGLQTLEIVYQLKQATGPEVQVPMRQISPSKQRNRQRVRQ